MKEKEFVKLDIVKFKEVNNIKTKCIADHVLLYLRYAISNIDTYRKNSGYKYIPIDKEYIDLVEQIYKEVRGNIFDSGVSTPSIIAGAIMIIASNLYFKNQFQSGYISQTDIITSLGMNTETALRRAKKKIMAFFTQKDIKF